MMTRALLALGLGLGLASRGAAMNDLPDFRLPEPLAGIAIHDQPLPQAPGGPPTADRVHLGHARPPEDAPPPKLQISTVVFMDFARYSHTGFAPQFLSEINPPGPGNDGFSSFDVSRAYMNFYFRPSDRITMRVTPNLFREIGVPPAEKDGKVTVIGTTLEGDLGLRLKYCYLDWNKVFDATPALRGGRITLGLQQNPLVEWQEKMYGYRFVNLTNWNYVGLSSTFTGLAFKGPVWIDDQQRIFYEFGVFNEGSYHALELSNRKQVQGRFSFFPFGAKDAYDGFGISTYFDFSSPNVTPDSGLDANIDRFAEVLHYTTPRWGLAFEWDQGKDAFSSGSLFTASGPPDEFGLGATGFGPLDALAKAILNNPTSHQHGFDVFGHYLIPGSKVDLFFDFQQFRPNTDVPDNPFDIHRLVAGASYRFSDYLRVALDYQGLDFVNDPFFVPAGILATYSPALAATNPAGLGGRSLGSTRALFANLEFSF